MPPLQEHRLEIFSHDPTLASDPLDRLLRHAAMLTREKNASELEGVPGAKGQSVCPGGAY